MSHLANDPLPTNKLQRRLTIFLEAPPGDGLRAAREHFLEYVKPVLSAASVDYDVVEGRRQGDIRVGLAEKIRRRRRRAGEQGGQPGEEEEKEEERADLQTALEKNRAKTGVEEWDGVGGDLVIGRHAWKEYIRGLHEGWLGPLRVPAVVPTVTTEAPSDPGIEPSSTPDDRHQETSDDASPVSEAEQREAKETQPEQPPKPLVPPPYNTPSSYPSSQLARSTPAELTPSAPIAFPHLLGFLNTPVRMWRFINRRFDADNIGRQTAAAVLATHRSFRQNEPSASTSSFAPEEPVTADARGSHWEQDHVLRYEEPDWPKSIRKRPEGEEERELEWLDAMVLDERIAARMRLFEVDRENKERANRIAKGAKGVPGRVNEPRSDYEE